jgi:hypothetical protein
LYAGEVSIFGISKSDSYCTLYHDSQTPIPVFFLNDPFIGGGGFIGSLAGNKYHYCRFVKFLDESYREREGNINVFGSMGLDETKIGRRVSETQTGVECGTKLEVFY